MSDKGERAELLKEEAVESLRLTVELFNRPYSLGRQRGALLHLGTGFELLLKSAILRLGGGIDTRGTNEQTIGLTKCINRCHTGSHIDEVFVLPREPLTELETFSGCRDVD